MTWPWPSGNENGWPRSHDASNCLPVDQELPTYWTVTLSPAFAAGPWPTTRSFLISELGGSPEGMAIFGLCLRSLAFATATAPPGAAAVVWVSVGAGALWVWAGALLCLSLLSDPPHPAARASTASRGAKARSDGMGGDPRGRRWAQSPLWTTRRP